MRVLDGVALFLAALVAWSRVCLGLHFPSDALAGAALGGVSAWACCSGPKWRVLPRHRATAMPNPDTPRA